MCVQLVQDYAFKEFGDEREIRNRVVVFEVVWVEVKFLEERTNDGGL